MRIRAAAILLVLPLLLAAGEIPVPPAPPAPPTPLARAAAIKAAAPLVDQMEQKLTTDHDEAVRLSRRALETLLPAVANPAVHDPAAALLLGRIALVTEGVYDVSTALAMLDECAKDSPADAKIKDLAARVKSLRDADIYDYFLKERAELRQNLLKARTGDLDAMYAAGDAYVTGGGTLTDLASAKRYFSAAAANGHAQSMAGMAIFEQTDSKILDWLEKSVAAGNYAAADGIGELYAGKRLGALNTHDVPRDLDKAFAWYRISFHAGYPDSAEALGKLCLEKPFSGYDPPAALAYFAIAADHARPDAIKVMKDARLGQLDPGFTFRAPSVKPQPGTEPPPIAALVESVPGKGPAAEKLKPNDIITAVNGNEFASEFEMRRLMNMSEEGKLTFKVLRGEQEMPVVVYGVSKPLK